MKVARWKVLSLAGVLALGYVATSDAAQIKVSDDTWANFGLNMKIWYKNLDERNKSGDWTKNEFSVGNAKVYFVGQVNKLFQFYGEFDQEKSGDNVGEAAINLAFAKEFQVQVGKVRKPFTRSDIASGYAQLIPTPFFYDPQSGAGRNINVFTYDGNNDYGAVVHGDLAGGMLNYRIGVFNNDKREKKNKAFEWNARIEFTPTMLGFKPESAATITGKTSDTYLGAKDILTIGLGYMSAKKDKDNNSTNNSGDDTVDGWTIDLTFEKKFGNLVPNLQLGYVSLSDTHRVAGKAKDSDAWYAQGQLLYDQMVGFGKPALAIRFDSTENDKNAGGKDAKLDRWGVALNYYIKGQAARISLGFDHAKYKDGSKDILKAAGKEDKITDWYLYFQSQF